MNHLTQAVQQSSSSSIVPPEPLKKFNFFTVQPLQQQNDLSSIKLSDIAVSDIGIVKNKIILLDRSTNNLLVYNRFIEGFWKPHSQVTLKMLTKYITSVNNDVILTYGEDAQNQMRSIHIKLWILTDNVQDYSMIRPKKTILIGKLGEPQKIISSMHLLNDVKILTCGTRKGNIQLYQSNNLLQNDYKIINRVVSKNQVNAIGTVRRNDEIDIYFGCQGSFYWFENLIEKRRINELQIQVLYTTSNESILVAFKKHTKLIHEYYGGKQIRSYYLDGMKKIIRQYKENYLIIVTMEEKNEKNQKSMDKYYVQIMDKINIYIAYYETFSKVQSVLINNNYIVLVVLNQKGQRIILLLNEKDNSFKIQTFFKRSFYNQAWRFAKNQKCQQSLMAEISRLHGDQLYTRSDFAGAISQYTIALGYLQPSYVIRKFLDVSQIDYLIEYLQKIHQKKMAKKQHTALLLNCYVKKQKINDLSKFLSQSSLQSDLFDIETAIDVCKKLGYFDQAMKLAEQKKKHELYLKILIENKKDYQKGLQYIKIKVPLQQKQKYIIEFGQQFMRYIPKQTISIIKLLIRAHSISQFVRGKQRDYTLSNEQKRILEELYFDYEQLQTLTIVTFKKPDDFFRLFLGNFKQDLQQFLLYLLNQIPKLPHQQVVFHRLIQFYLEMMKQSPSKKNQCQNKILEHLNNTMKKPDNNHLLALFKMYQFDQGVITLCQKLGMRDDLLNFYIAKNRDKDILLLCKQHGLDEVNLWIHALKYFVKPQYNKQYYIPQILKELSKIENLSPLPILGILSKNKNIQYSYIKNFFLQKLENDRRNIEIDHQIVLKNIKKAQESREQLKKLKTQSKSFLDNICMQCQNSLSFPSLHFMCGHSFHESCLGGEKQCYRCGFEMRNIIQRKQRYQQGALDQTKLFQTLHERKQSGFQVVAQFMGKGMFSLKP